MNITRGSVPHALKCVIYGVEGIGKTSLASQFPDPLFIDTEGGSMEYDVARMDVPSSWQMLLDEAAYVRDTPGICKTLVLDTADWAERLCIDHVCGKSTTNEDGVKGIEQFGYGKGYRYVADEFGGLVNLLGEVADKGIHVVITAHAAMRKFEQPDETGAYDRWELKLINTQKCSISGMIKEWADMVLFLNYKTNTVSVDKEGKKKKAMGRGQRVMYSSHHSCWDAKNRFGLADELPLDYTPIGQVIDRISKGTKQGTQEAASSVEKSAASAAKSGNKKESGASKKPVPEKKEEVKPEAEEIPRGVLPDSTYVKDPDPRIPKALRDLMIANKVTEWDIENVVSQQGYYPSDVPVTDYDPGFIQGVLVGAWEQVYKKILEVRNEDVIPF